MSSSWYVSLSIRIHTRAVANDRRMEEVSQREEDDVKEEMEELLLVEWKQKRDDEMQMTLTVLSVVVQSNCSRSHYENGPVPAVPCFSNQI